MKTKSQMKTKLVSLVVCVLLVSAACGASVYKDAFNGEYIALEYLESTGEQWINTMYIHSEKTIVDMKAAIVKNPGSSNWYNYYGARKAQYDKNQFGAWVHGDHHYCGIGDIDNDLEGDEWKYTEKEPFYLHLDASGPRYVNDTSFTVGTLSMSQDFALQAYLFALNQNNSASFKSKARIYWCIIREDDVAVRDFVPVKRSSDGKPGMLDRVNGQFYANAGTGADFTAGPELDSVPDSAAWTGVAGNGEISDAGNWRCSDPSGATLENAIPDETTRTIVLEADADWSGSSGTLASRAAQIDLDGHELRTAVLPSIMRITDTAGKYELLEYIQSTGSGDDCPYIDTLYRCSAKTKADLKVAFPALPSKGGWFAYIGGRRKANTGAQFGGWIHNANGTTYHYAGMTSSEQDVAAIGAVAVNTPYTIHLDNASGATSTVDGKSLVAGNGNSSGLNILLFTLADLGFTGPVDIHGRRSYVVNSYTGACRIYYCKIYTGDRLDRDFVPVRRVSDGAIGMLDKVSWKFYGNAGGNGNNFSAGSVAGSLSHGSSATGRLVVANALGTAENKRVEFTGSLRLVKDGAGTFVLSKEHQTYCGGTEVVGGVLKAGLDLNLKFPLGAKGTAVKIGSGAKFDVNSAFDLFTNKGFYRFVLAGGTLSNMGADVANNFAQLVSIALERDSSLHASGNFALVGNSYAATAIDLGGKRLSVSFGTGKSFVCSNTSVTEGTIETSGDGWFGLGSASSENKGGTFKGNNLNFVVNSGLGVYENATIRNYEPRYNGDRNLGSKTLNVTGVFKPSAHDYFYGPTMQDGSTIDLSARTMPLGAVSSNTTGNASLKFAANASVNIDLGSRNVKTDTKLIAWTVKPSNIDTVAFSICGPSGSWLELKDDGLWYRRPGLVLKLR